MQSEYRIHHDKDHLMCLGVPMRIKAIDGFSARCEARGIERQASLFLLQHEDLQVGDLVMIHVGNAIQKMTDIQNVGSFFYAAFDVGFRRLP